MALEAFLGYGIKKTLSNNPKQTGYYKPQMDIQKSVIEYVFGNSKIILPSFSSKGPFGLLSFKALAESEHFAWLVFRDERILSITEEIKEIYLKKIVNRQNISIKNLIENHMKPLIRILFDPYLSSNEFYKRASVLKENLLLDKGTYVPEEILFPQYYAEQEKIIKKRNSQRIMKRKYTEFLMAA